jgi:hypothetical protein
MKILRLSDDSISFVFFFFCEECTPQSTNVQFDNVMLCRVVSLCNPQWLDTSEDNAHGSRLRLPTETQTIPLN